MTSKIFAVAIIIAAIVGGTAGFGSAQDQPGRSSCGYMTAADCQQQAMRGLTPEQRLNLQNDYQRRIEPASPQNYPSGLKYRTSA